MVYFQKAKVVAAAQQTFHLERNNFLSEHYNNKDLISIFLTCIFHKAAPNADSNPCPPEVKSHLIKYLQNS